MMFRLGAFAAGVAATAALFGSLVAFGQGVPGFIHPAVIDIQEEVPVLVEVDGSTVPFTVGISLRVDLSGPVTASVEAVSTPVVEAAMATPVSRQVDNLGISYVLENDADLHGIKWTATDLLGDIMLQGEFVNPSAAREIGAFGLSITSTFYDAGGNVLGVGMGMISGAPVAPGQRATFTLLSDTSVSDVDSYTLQFR